MKKSISACLAAVSAFEEIRQKKFQPSPDGWFTCRDLADEQDCGETKAKTIIVELRRAGQLESKRWPIKDSIGRTHYKTIHRIKKV